MRKYICNRKRETIIFRGRKYHRYVESKLRTERCYYTARIFGKTGLLLHRQIWIKYRGSIPRGMVIHHKDGNTLNNKISNLEMITSSEHASMHMTPERRKISAGMMRINGKFGHAWHSTPKGRAFHRKKIAEYWKNPTRYPRVCEDCKKSFSAYKSVTRFCSNRCMQRTYRKV